MGDPVSDYVEAVLDGEIVAGRLVKLACERHRQDRKESALRGIRFDQGAAAHIIGFFEEFLTLDEGQNEGQPFILQPWQRFILGSVFGWRRRADNFRRFRTAYIESGKGSGKTPMAAGVGLYGLVADGEHGAHIYSAATMRDQAKICWSDAEHMVAASNFLRRRVQVNVNNLSVTDTNSFFRPISSEHKGLDGKRVHIALIDEIHEHSSGMVVDKMRAGTKGRRQALIWEITNSGFNRHSICYNHHEYSVKVLEGIVRNDAWFAYICQLDTCDRCLAEGKTTPVEGCPDCDDWRDPRVWLKANPNLGVSITERYLREQVDEAVGMPSKVNIVRRLNFCAWTETDVRWLPLADWDACSEPIDVAALAGRECYGGLDLASVSDLIAFVLYFPSAEGPDIVLSFFWLPEDTANARWEGAGVPYPEWVREHHIRTTPGNIADYDQVRADIVALAAQYNIREIGYDRWNATQLVTQLTGDGLAMVPIGQGFASMSAPCKELEKRIRQHSFTHGGNPVMRWMASNVAAEMDGAGNIKPSKARSSEKIDGIVALVLALARLIVNTEEGPSIYETRGLDRA